MLLFLRCDSTLHEPAIAIERKGEARWCTGDKKHITISYLRECDCDDGGHSNDAKEVKEGHS
jgi:hypothetical protein